MLADAPRTEGMRPEREKERKHQVRGRAESRGNRQARDGENARDLIGDEPSVARGSITRPSLEYEATEAKGEKLSPRGTPRPHDFFPGRRLRVATVRLAPVTQIPMVHEMLVAEGEGPRGTYCQVGQDGHRLVRSGAPEDEVVRALMDEHS